MTTLYEEKIACAVCGKKDKYTFIGSTNTFFGSPDIDLRPCDLERSTITHWVKRCPHCGYCAGKIGEAPDNAKSIIESDVYRSQLENPDYPELANSFLCRAMVEEKNGETSKAACSTHFAAWACDDAENEKSARACREKALDLVKETMSKGQKLTEEDQMDVLIAVDLMRRTGRFEEASRFIDENRHRVEEGVLVKVLDFQRELISRSDTECHMIAEATGEG